MDYASGKRKAWHFIRLGIGWLLTLIGIILLVLPGPGVLFLIPGLTLLSAESAGVRKFLQRMRRQHLIKKAIRQAERAGIKIDWGPEEDEPPDAPPGPSPGPSSGPSAGPAS